MKKFFAVFLLALLPAAVFAGGKQEDNNYLSLNFGVPILWETAEEDGRTVDSRMVSVVTGLSFATYFNDVIGLYTEFDFFVSSELYVGGRRGECHKGQRGL